jgi:chaperonin GroES
LDKNGKRKDFQVKKGDRVIFSSYAGTEVKLDGDEYLILSEDDILGVVEA